MSRLSVNGRVCLLIILFFVMPVSAIQANDYKQIALAVLHGDQSDNEAREALFRLDLNTQRRLKAESEARLSRAEVRQAQLKAQFDQNEDRLSDLQTKLEQRSGILGEIFGVAKEHALDLKTLLRDSLINAEYRSREDALSFAELKRVPSISDIEKLYHLLASELEQNGQISSFVSEVVDEVGVSKATEVTRFGVFSVVDEEGSYLTWDAARQSLRVLPVQPSESFRASPVPILDDVVLKPLLDPSRGELFALLSQMPSLADKVEQGGKVAYVIIALGLVGMLVAIYQLIRLIMTESGVRRQLLSSDMLNTSNPLGRVLHKLKSVDIPNDVNALEVKIDEAVLAEIPHIEQGQSFLKLLAAVAPLLGLLGTVVGMIATFQSITLFGTGDPKMMAAGISQALVTTVLGLLVAVPVLFFHSILSTRGRRLIQILQEKSLAAISEHHRGVVTDSKLDFQNAA